MISERGTASVRELEGVAAGIIRWSGAGCVGLGWFGCWEQIGAGDRQSSEEEKLRARKDTQREPSHDVRILKLYMCHGAPRGPLERKPPSAKLELARSLKSKFPCQLNHPSRASSTAPPILGPSSALILAFPPPRRRDIVHPLNQFSSKSIPPPTPN